MDTTIATIVVAVLSLIGTLGGAYLANKKSTALIAYRLEQLEEKVNKHNSVIERTYELEKKETLVEHDIEEIKHQVENLKNYHR